MDNPNVVAKRFRKEIQYRRDMYIPDRCVALGKIDKATKTISPVLFDAQEGTLYRLPEVPNMFFYLEADYLGMLSRHFVYPSSVATSAIFAYVVQISDEACGANVFSCDRAQTVWRLLLSACVFDRWRTRDKAFRTMCLDVWSNVMETQELDTLNKHEHGMDVMQSMFKLCLECIDEIDYTLVPENAEEESAYWACLDHIEIENLRFCASLN